MRVRHRNPATLDRIDKLATNKQPGLNIQTRFYIYCHLELRWVRLQLTATISIRQRAIVVLPDQQHRTLRRKTFVANVRRHRRNIAGLHDDFRARLSAAPVLDLPNDLVARLNKPFDAIISMEDRQDVFFRRRTHQTVLHDRADRGIPGDVGSREITEQIERVNFALKSRFGVNLRLILRNITKLAIDRVAVRVGAVAGIAGQSDHAFGHDTLALHRFAIVTVLGPVRLTGFIRRGEWIEALIGPVVQHAFEGSLDFFGIERLDVRTVRFAITTVA